MTGLGSHNVTSIIVTSLIRFLTLAIAIGSLAFIPTILSAETSPLLQKVKQLQCAKNQQEAEIALESLRTSPTLSIGLPSENLSNQPDDRLYAGSLDITLDVLVKTVDKYPELRNLVERTMLKWNYCKVLEDNQFFDVLSDAPRQQVKYQPPLQWRGFEQLGFLQPEASFIPKLLSEPPISKQAFERFFHRIYRKQCFSHPTTGKLYHRQRGTISQKLIVKKFQENRIYPYAWDDNCPQDKQDESKATIVKTIESVKTDEVATTKPSNIKKTEQTPKPFKVIVHVKFPSTPPLEKIAEPKQEVTTSVEPFKEETIKTTPKPKKISKPKITKKSPKIKIEPKKPTKLSQILLPKKTDTLIVTAPAPSASVNSTAPVVISTKDPDKSFGLTGNVYMKYRLANEKPTFGINASWKPIAESYWFARMNLDYDYTQDDPISYSWGLGYDDWHKGTWSAQINHWGPIKRGQGLDIDNAIGNIGYKFKGKWLEKYNLHSNTSVDIPIKGDPSLNLGLTWKPKENWFLRTNINQPLNGDDPTWSYVFGYSNWRPNKWNIEYANYGPNNLFDTNFRKNGVVNVSYNWEF